MSPFTEQSVVEDDMITKLQQAGWKFIPPDNLERERMEEPLLLPNLIRAIKKINAKIVDETTGISDEEVNKVVNELKLTGSGQEGLRQILNWFKTGIPVKFEKDRVVRYVQLFDYNSITSNEFIVSRQVTYRSTDRSIRADIVLYVNGIPLVVIECKTVVSYSVNWVDAFKDIKDYEKTVPELFKYVQIGVALAHTAKYFPIVPWQEEVNVEEWKEEGKDSIDSIVYMLSPERLMDIIKNFLFFRSEHGTLTRVITRYMQYRAVNKIVDRILNHIQGKEKKNKGLIWHWQGSGKTLTMIFAAYKLYHHPLMENPSIFFVVDRIDLQEQFFKEIAALDMPDAEIIGSNEDLKSVLRHDGYMGKRGLMVLLIHKFNPEEIKDVMEEMETVSGIRGCSIMTRSNVIVFLDEAHRTQYGTLAAQMKAILRNAYFFAFTGTPISKRERDTYREFSYPPEENYLDKYFIRESITDGFTVKIAYQPRLEKDVHLNKELLEAFLETEYEELPADVKPYVEDRISKKISAITLFLERADRIRKVCNDIAEHFKENIERRFKAMVVAATRKACVIYKNELDRILPPEYSEIVMTFTPDDDQEIKDYHTAMTDRFKQKEDQEIRKEIINNYKFKENPKILIVTDMLLTGFDAPILQTMYLDKPLKEHRLLQAIARTNRPYKGVKEAGLIVDYVGILKNFKRAFELYSEDEFIGALYDLEEIRQEFIELMNNLLSLFKGVKTDRFDRKTLLDAIKVITIDDKQCEFFLESVKKLKKLFELLGPDMIKLEHLSDYKWIIAVHTYYMVTVARIVPRGEMFVDNYMQKTLKYVYKTTEIDEFKKDLPPTEFNEKFLQELEEKVKNTEEKAANIVFALNKFVLVEKANDPVFESVAEKVERLITLWREKNKDFEEIYREGTDVISDITQIGERQKALNLSQMEYAILVTLEKKFGTDQGLINDTKEITKLLNEKKFPGWTSQKSAMKEAERDIRKFLWRYIKRYNITLNDINEISQKLIEVVKRYGEES